MSAAPSLAPQVRLRHDAARGQWVLLAPERVVVLDEVAHAILSRLDGRTTIDGIAAALAREYEAPPAEIAADVREALEDLHRKGLVRL
ncbi:pyrroloquinoline quinone biosynthesis peptide chaperone PqqD [Roseomonas sp. M0104]|uniref:Pyrroloquinoline quinone biosynthesis peptide chaperone PqqD n=1 Tax=Teichococcus coralli TaxID=2545983 RepID=A0A845BBW4_9PROT|nr:pyrroloquinoline quinone biosynthesis peptide chaperone PqqD [Pseudoroseomonas coralli]MXP63616.1 pyrroloquinoline quinone biosynthesis peptide chaperone PqqD [Pseudoroseomonas coralli]